MIKFISLWYGSTASFNPNYIIVRSKVQKSHKHLKVVLGISSSTMKIWLYLEYSFIKLKISISNAESLQQIIHFITKVSPQSTMTQGITLGRVICHIFPQLREKIDRKSGLLIVYWLCWRKLFFFVSFGFPNLKWGYFGEALLGVG